VACHGGKIFDEAGRWLRGGCGSPAPPGDGTGQPDLFDSTVRRLGYVHVRPCGDALMVEFHPQVVSRLAVIAAFYELADRAPKKIVLACGSDSNRFEIFSSRQRACRRIEELIKRNP
jgi:hypothetical protein